MKEQMMLLVAPSFLHMPLLSALHFHIFTIKRLFMSKYGAVSVHILPSDDGIIPTKTTKN